MWNSKILSNTVTLVSIMRIAQDKFVQAINPSFYSTNETTKNAIKEFEKGKNVKAFEFAKKELTFFPIFLNEYQNLEKIDLFENEISYLPENFVLNLNCLKELDLGNNLLVSFSSNFVSELKNLEKLDFFNNKLRSFPSLSATPLKKLKHLNLKYNKLTSLPDDFGKGLENLEFLDLGSNRLTHLPASLPEYCKKIKYLNLSDNIDMIPSSPNDTTKLGLEEIKKAFDKKVTHFE